MRRVHAGAAVRFVGWWLYLHAIRWGYLIRPYDMLADRRRWCWQRCTRCLVLVVKDHTPDV